MSDVAENINSINVKEFPVEIVWIGERGEVSVRIGDMSAEIAEPKPLILEKGYVFLGTEDIEEIDWEDLISCDIPGLGRCEGFTDDPRLVDIGRKVFNGESFGLKPGTIIPPQGKE
ncbi:MAG: hypothetical protein LBD60_02390 [Puniceicoccales bacterium]|jgi:hypothetical protein|nr:hypothetical protein [Puniceicoccales bacterium]